MITSKNRVGITELTKLLVIMTWAASAGLPSPQSCAQQVQIPTEINKALEQSGASLDPVSIEWKETYSNVVTSETSSTVRPAGVTLTPTTIRVYDTHWTSEKIFSRKLQLLPANSNEQLNAFDGRISANAVVGKSLGKAIPKPDDTLFTLGYFDAAGWAVPRCGTAPAGRIIRSHLLLAIEQGATVLDVQKVQIDDREAMRIQLRVINKDRQAADNLNLAAQELVMRQNRKSDSEINSELARIRWLRATPATLIRSYYLDPAMNYAIRRDDDRFENGTLVNESVNSEFEQAGKLQVWLPRRSVQNFFIASTGLSPLPVKARDFVVTRIDLSPIPDSQFVLSGESTPGTRIFDRTSGTLIAHDVPLPSKQIDELARKVQSPTLGILPALPESESVNGIWIYVIGLNAAALMALSWFLARRNSVKR